MPQKSHPATMGARNDTAEIALCKKKQPLQAISSPARATNGQAEHGGLSIANGGCGSGPRSGFSGSADSPQNVPAVAPPRCADVRTNADIIADGACGCIWLADSRGAIGATRRSQYGVFQVEHN